MLTLVAAFLSALLLTTSTACSGCRDVSYAADVRAVLACSGGSVRIRSAPCFGAPDACTYSLGDRNVTFTVEKEDCSSGPTSAGCSEASFELDCSGPSLAPGQYEASGTRFEVRPDGTCAPSQ